MTWPNPAQPGVPERPDQDGWDRWYASLPPDLTRRLSLHDFKRLGDCFKAAFRVGPTSPDTVLVPRVELERWQGQATLNDNGRLYDEIGAMLVASPAL